MIVAREILNLESPITVRCGLVGIKNYALADFLGVSFGADGLSGVSYESDVITDTIVEDYNHELIDILADFRKAVWEVFVADEALCESAVRDFNRGDLSWR